MDLESREAAPPARRGRSTILLWTSVTVVVLAACIAVGIVSNHGSGGSGASADLTGTWRVTAIAVGSDKPLDIPAGFEASFSFDRAERALDVSAGGTSYGCSFRQTGNRVQIVDCLAAPVGVLRTDKVASAIATAFDRAFSTTETILVERRGDSGLTLRMGDVVFVVRKAR
jgi:hypothetical protein